MPINSMIIIGHRGAGGSVPENTLKAFEYAISCGVAMVELDVHICSSGELVVIHDETVDRTTTGTGLVSAHIRSAIQRYNAGDGQKVPTLREVIEYIDRRVVINIELKGDGTALPVASLIAEYVEKRGYLYTDFVVSSFNSTQLAQFKKGCPQVKVGVIYCDIPLEWQHECRQLGAKMLVLDDDLASVDIVKKAHQMGLQVFVFTVNDPVRAKQLKTVGVDGLITDCPVRMQPL